jgi:hypothetical protein
MFFIQLDDNGNPTGHPLIWDNVIHLVDGAENMNQENWSAMKLAEIKNFNQPVNLPDDSEATPGEIIKNDDGSIERQWIITPLPVEEKVRRWILGPRESHLLLSDWTQLVDAPLSEEKRVQWATYRQALRDMTHVLDLENISRRMDITWPQPPTQLSKNSKWAKDIPNIGTDPIIPG